VYVCMHTYMYGDPKIKFVYIHTQTSRETSALVGGLKEYTAYTILLQKWQNTGEYFLCFSRHAMISITSLILSICMAQITSRDSEYLHGPDHQSDSEHLHGPDHQFDSEYLHGSDHHSSV
jgi:hypothetical protein